MALLSFLVSFFRDDDTTKVPDACRFHGTLVVNKVAGNFHITAGKWVDLSDSVYGVSGFLVILHWIWQSCYTRFDLFLQICLCLPTVDPCRYFHAAMRIFPLWWRNLVRNWGDCCAKRFALFRSQVYDMLVNVVVCRKVHVVFILFICKLLYYHSLVWIIIKSRTVLLHIGWLVAHSAASVVILQ